MFPTCRSYKPGSDSAAQPGPVHCDSSRLHQMSLPTNGNMILLQPKATAQVSVFCDVDYTDNRVWP